MKLSKRTFFWVIPLAVLIIFIYFYGPKKEITSNESIDEVKAQSFSAQDERAIGDVLANYCPSNKWIYFKSQKEQAVVEFKGKCMDGEQEQAINLQFLVDTVTDEATLGALLINEVQQTKEQKEAWMEQLYNEN